jgi:hydroxymethylbilane synthase
MDTTQTIRLGTRGSVLARWQTDHVSQLLRATWPEFALEILVLTTQGDRNVDTPLPLIGVKGVFTAELEAALQGRRIDFAVHSLKDLPTENGEGLTIGALTRRATPNDVLISRNGYTLNTLPQGAVVGTCSHRRAAQILHQRPDLRILDIRGNVDTRIRKALDPAGYYNAIVLAYAGLERLGWLNVVSEILSLDDMLPAPGQAALAVQCRDEAQALHLLEPINDHETEIAVTAERTFLAGLGGGCSLPIAAYATIENSTLRLRGRVTAQNGTKQVDVRSESAVNRIAAQRLGYDLAQMSLDQGVAQLLETSA